MRPLQLFRRLNKPVKNQGSDAHWNTKGGQKVSKKNILKNTKALQSQGAAARWDRRGRLDTGGSGQLPPLSYLQLTTLH